MQSTTEYENFAREITVGSPWALAFGKFTAACPHFAQYFASDNEHNLENFGRVLCRASAYPPRRPPWKSPHKSSWSAVN